MTDLHQCGLCLSCGVPFMPSADDTDLFRHTGNLSVLFLNVEFKNNQEIRRQYQTPKFTSEKQESHVFHESHHFTALNHMCNHHVDDSNVTWGAAGGRAGGTLIADSGNDPLPYYKSPGSKKGKKAYAATWTRPTEEERLKFPTLLEHVIEAAQKETARSFAQNVKEKHAICRGCNLIMTQRNDMEYHLGLNRMRGENEAPLIRTTPRVPITQTKATDNGANCEDGYGVWTRGAGQGSLAPKGKNDDDLTPAIAYYLHMCLPFIDPADNKPNPFEAIVGANSAEMKRSARTLYLELSWLILEIGCVATLKERGRLYSPEGTRSHGPHQHSGVLDFYVSYFIYRLMFFEFNVDLQREGLDFVQWHQKYYSDAINCKELFKDNAGVARDGVLACMVCPTTVQPSKELLEQICDGLMQLYKETLKPLIDFTRGRRTQLNLPLGVKNYFLPLPAMLELRRRSGERVIRHDFESALRAFGASALLYRIVQLCKDCPIEFRAQLNDFRQSWQWVEIDHIRRNTPKLTLRAAHTIYLMCSLLDPPDIVPGDKGDVVEKLWQSEFCSPWTAVLPLDNVGAFEVMPSAGAAN